MHIELPIYIEEFDDPAEAKQRSDRMGDRNLLSRAPPCFGRHVKTLVPAVFVVGSTTSFKEGWGQAAVKIIAESLSQHDEKHVVQTPLSVGKKEEEEDWCILTREDNKLQ
jgi:hypothetical protein